LPNPIDTKYLNPLKKKARELWGFKTRSSYSFLALWEPPVTQEKVLGELCGAISKLKKENIELQFWE
jgi:hypothetical protein